MISTCKINHLCNTAHAVNDSLNVIQGPKRTNIIGPDQYLAFDHHMNYTRGGEGLAERATDVWPSATQ